MNAKVIVSISQSEALTALETMIKNSRPMKVEDGDIKRLEALLHHLRIRAAVQKVVTERSEQ